MHRRFENVEQGIEFSLRLFGLLREEGVKLGTRQTIACTKSITLLTAVQPDALLRIYRATLINRQQDFRVLQKLFGLLLDMHFSPEELKTSETKLVGEENRLAIETKSTVEVNDAPGDDDDGYDLPGYSVHEIDHHKDFRFIEKTQYPTILAILEQTARRYAAVTRRKTKRSQIGKTIDLRSSVRESVRYEGEILDWRYKKKIATHTRLTVIVDVSGSMEIYSVFLLNFLHLLNENRRFNIEVFVFSTELVSMTEYFRRRDFRNMLEDMSKHFSSWSGGTKIGQALCELNTNYAQTISRKTMVTIMSDGWDTGDADLLDREMRKLKRRAKSVVWINPLKGDPSYEPLALGMARARPYCDEFISGHSIAALENFADIAASR